MPDVGTVSWRSDKQKRSTRMGRLPAYPAFVRIPESKAPAEFGYQRAMKQFGDKEIARSPQD